MAEAAAPELTHSQMIAEMQKAGYAPPAVPTDPTHDQMIKEMQAAGFTPQGTQPAQWEKDYPAAATAVHGAIEDLPLAGGIVGAIGGGVIGTAIGGGVPNPGTAIVGGLGAGYGGELGSYAKDTLNNLIFGKQTSLMEAHQNAIAARDEQATGAVLGEGAVSAIGNLGKAALATKAGSKAGALISHVPAQVVKAYADGAERIKAAFSSSDESTFRMAQAAKEQYVTDIRATRTGLNKEIGEAVKGSDELISVDPIVTKLQSHMAELNPKIDGDQIAQIKELIGKAKAVAGKDKQLSLAEANQLKIHFQDIADAAGAYGQPGVSAVGTQAGYAAKAAGAVTRETMNKVAPEAVVRANNQLSTLHTIEDNMNKALLNPRKSAAPLINAGTGESAVGAKNLADLQDIQAVTGTNMVQPAQDVAAAQSLGRYKFSPSLRGLGQPIVKGAIDASTAMASGQANGIGATLGQSVMHGSGAVNAIRNNRP